MILIAFYPYDNNHPHLYCQPYFLDYKDRRLQSISAVSLFLHVISSRRDYHWSTTRIYFPFPLTPRLGCPWYTRSINDSCHILGILQGSLSRNTISTSSTTLAFTVQWNSTQHQQSSCQTSPLPQVSQGTLEKCNLLQQCHQLGQYHSFQSWISPWSICFTTSRDLLWLRLEALMCLRESWHWKIQTFGGP